MKKLIFLTLCLLFFAFVGYLFYPDHVGEVEIVNGQAYEVIKREVDTVIVPVTKVVFKQGKDIIHEKPIYVPIQGKVDTASIIAHYNSLQPITDTLTLDEGLGRVIVQDTLYRNQLRSRAYTAQINQKTISEKVYLKDLPKAQIWVGAQGPVPALTLGYVPKKKQRLMYEVNIGFRGAGVGVKWKIN